MTYLESDNQAITPGSNALVEKFHQFNLTRPRVPFPLLAALFSLAALVTVIVWAVASPPGSSPDEDFHLGSLTCPYPADQFCEVSMVEAPRPGTGEITMLPAIWIPFQTAHANCNAPVSALSAECFDVMADFGYTWSVRFDHAGENPVGFYRIMHSMRNLGNSLVDSIFAMRIINGTVAILLFGAAAYLFSHQNRRLMAYALLVVLAPMALYLIVSINPSGWGITGVALAWLGVHGFITERATWRAGGLLAIGLIGATMVALSRGDAALIAVVGAFAAALLNWNRIRQNWYLLFAPFAVAAVAIAGLISSGQVAGATAEGLAQGPGGFLLDNTLEMPQFLIDAIAGSLNWLDTPLPAIARIPILMAAAAVAFFGMRKMSIPKALALFGLLFVIYVLPLIMLEMSGEQLGHYVQARYLTPLVPLIMLTALWDPHKEKVHRFTNLQLFVIWGVLSLGHAWALHTQILRFTHGLLIRWWNLNTAPEWWAFGISPMATWVIGALAFPILLLALFAVSGKHRQLENLPGTKNTRSTEQQIEVLNDGTNY